MRKYWFCISILFLFSFFATNSNAQNIKIGVVDILYINKAVSSSAIENLNLKKDEQQYFADIEKEKKELDARIAARIKAVQQSRDVNLATTIENETIQLNTKVKLKQEALQKRKALYEATMQKSIKEAIQQVAKEKNYTTILEVQNTPYFSEESNITNLVLIKLGIQ